MLYSIIDTFLQLCTYFKADVSFKTCQRLQLFIIHSIAIHSNAT